MRHSAVFYAAPVPRMIDTPDHRRDQSQAIVCVRPPSATRASQTPDRTYKRNDYRVATIKPTATATLPANSICVRLDILRRFIDT